MAEKTVSPSPTASSLKRELEASLEQLQRDFVGLQNFIAELACEDTGESIHLPQDDLRNLLVVTEAIHDAASDLAFEADKIREKLRNVAE